MFKCEICGKEFPSRESYGGHKSGHARVGRKRKDEHGNKIPSTWKDEIGAVCKLCGKPTRKNNSFCSRTCVNEYRQREWEKKWIDGEIDGYNETDHWGNTPDRIRNYLFQKHGSKCAKCGWGEVNTYTKKIPLEVEHIDGNYRNNRPENVTLLCPNCHSLTEFYRGANRGNGRKRTWRPSSD
jgi:hypothetical protein